MPSRARGAARFETAARSVAQVDSAFGSIKNDGGLQSSVPVSNLVLTIPNSEADRVI